MHLQGQNGLLHTYREGYRTRNAVGIVIALAFCLFYTWLYFQDELRNTVPALKALPTFDEIASSVGLKNRWFLYGGLYSFAMVGGAIYYLRRHGNSRYNQVRIAVNVAVQIILAFALPFFMMLRGQKEYYFSYFWPLSFDKLWPSSVEQYPLYIIVYSAVGSLVIVPALALRYGKRWYCSWVCGCGGLANTFGDPWRHLTSKSSSAWRFERWSVHGVLIVIVLTTLAVVADDLDLVHSDTFHRGVAWARTAYWYVVGAALAGVVGVGFYPLFGPRVWCRHFCPMAALLGLVQKAGRFRIRVKDNMCISCGNCSTYCEMGIDVRAYAQRNESFTRAACVGCGACAHVCPRGVLRLENVKEKNSKRTLPLAPTQ